MILVSTRYIPLRILLGTGALQRFDELIPERVVPEYSGECGERMLYFPLFGPDFG